MTRRRTVSRALAIAWLSALGGCAATQPAVPRAKLQLSVNVPDASVWIDDRFVGTAASWAKGGSLPAGFHRIEVRHPGHFSFYAEVNPREGETTRVTAVLRPTLD